MGSVCIGIDIGQKRDPTAICVVEVEERTDDTYFLVRHLERLALGTAYPQVATRVAVVVKQVRRRMSEDGASLSVYADATGVGLPVVDLLKAAGVRVTPVLFTYGDKRTVDREQGRVTLGKAWLVSRLQALLQSGRLLLPDTSEARALAQELLDYEIKVSEDGDLKAGAFRVGSHDDLVTALGLATQLEPVVFALATIVPATATPSSADLVPGLLDATRRELAHARYLRGIPEPAAAAHDDDDEDDEDALPIATAGAQGGTGLHDPRALLRRLGIGI